jgi:hypothetical protein
VPQESAANASVNPEKRITLSLRDVSFYEALEKITAQAGVKFWIRRDGVHTGLAEPGLTQPTAGHPKPHSKDQPTTSPAR